MEKNLELGLRYAAQQMLRNRFLVLSILVFCLAAAAYQSSRTVTQYRTQARVIPYTAAELTSGTQPGKWTGLALLEKYVQTVNSEAFRYTFYNQNISKNGTVLPPEVPTYAHFTSQLVAKQMADEYAVIHFLSTNPDRSDKWVQELVESANVTIRDALVSQDKARLEQVQQEIAKRKAFARTLVQEAYTIQLESIAAASKKLGLKSSDTKPVLHISPEISGLSGTTERLMEASFSAFSLPGAVKVMGPAQTSLTTVGPSRWFLLFYGLIGGLVISFFAVQIKEFLANFKLSVGRRNAESGA